MPVEHTRSSSSPSGHASTGSRTRSPKVQDQVKYQSLGAAVEGADVHHVEHSTCCRFYHLIALLRCSLKEHACLVCGTSISGCPDLQNVQIACILLL